MYLYIYIYLHISHTVYVCTHNNVYIYIYVYVHTYMYTNGYDMGIWSCIMGYCKGIEYDNSVLNGRTYDIFQLLPPYPYEI